MAETDILNPLDWQTTLPFNPNPSYGFARKMGANRQQQRPRAGSFPARDVMDGGHIFTLQWIGVPLAIAERIVNFYHDFKAGYFTLIDVDNNGRHYVGRFMSEPEPTHTANGKYSIQGVTFEEVPTARMLTFPTDFSLYGHTINVIDDVYLSPLIAGMVGTWTPSLIAGGLPATAPSSYEFLNATSAVGDWAQAQYVGWGFRLIFPVNAAGGIVSVSLDGIAIVTGLDLSQAGGGVPVIPTSSLSVQVLLIAASGSSPAMLQVMASTVPLDIHRVKVMATGAGSATDGTRIVYPALEYIY